MKTANQAVNERGRKVILTKFNIGATFLIVFPKLADHLVCDEGADIFGFAKFFDISILNDLKRVGKSIVKGVDLIGCVETFQKQASVGSVLEIELFVKGNDLIGRAIGGMFFPAPLEVIKSADIKRVDSPFEFDNLRIIRFSGENIKNIADENGPVAWDKSFFWENDMPDLNQSVQKIRRSF